MDNEPSLLLGASEEFHLAGQNVVSESVRLLSTRNTTLKNNFESMHLALMTYRESPLTHC